LTAPVKFTMSVVLVGRSLKVTIPRELATYMGLRKGDTVSMWADNSYVVIEKQGVQDSRCMEKEKDAS